MPKYLYRCPECGNKQEHERSVHDPEPSLWLCMPCAMNNTPPKYVWVKRVFQVAGVVFRGGGWASKS
jgi:predicted nucleic acid-binding Zn ribbon protein